MAEQPPAQVDSFSLPSHLASRQPSLKWSETSAAAVAASLQRHRIVVNVSGGRNIDVLPNPSSVLLRVPEWWCPEIKAAKVPFLKVLGSVTSETLKIKCTQDSSAGGAFLMIA